MFLPILVASSLALAAPSAEEVRAAQMKNQVACDAARKSLDGYLAEKFESRGCPNIDSYCVTAYLSADSCAPPIVIRKDLHPDTDQRLLALQAEMRKACEQLWRGRPACEPLGAQPACRKGKCVDLSRLPPEPPPPFKLSAEEAGRKFSHGTATPSCAPSDGPAVAFTLAREAPACGQEPRGARISVNLWEPAIYDKLRPGADFTGDGGASYCESAPAKNCVPLKWFHLRLVSFSKTGKFRARFEGGTRDGVKIPEQEFEAEWCDAHPLCG